MLEVRLNVVCTKTLTTFNTAEDYANGTSACFLPKRTVFQLNFFIFDRVVMKIC